MKRTELSTQEGKGADNGYHSAKRVCKGTSFRIEPKQKFNSKFPYYRQPREIGHFSQNSHREFCSGKSQLKKYCQPTNKSCVSFDLKQGYSKFIKRDDSTKEYLDDLLKWIVLNKNLFQVDSQTNQCLNTDFICWRGLLTKLLCTPYENRDNWKFASCKVKNTIFMCEYETDEKKEQKATETERQREMSYWGYKFEQYVTANMEAKGPTVENPVNNYEGFCSVVRTRLNNHSLVFGGEVDCCDRKPSGQIENISYIELKTSRIIENRRQENNFKKFKLLKWWAQSFLIGIPKIICGFRDDEGVVKYLKNFSVKDIPKECQDVDDIWQSSICFNFLNQFLQHVKDTLSESDPQEVHIFEWSPRQDITCTKHGSGSLYHFLPQWFLSGETDIQNYPSGETTARYTCS